MRPLLLFVAATLAASSALAGACPALLDHKFTTVQGQEIDLCQYAGRPILVVNTASRCGFTPQFSKLQEMYREYREKGLMVLGFPSNDFRQELATNREVGEFCLTGYGVTFPMMQMSSVKGGNANPLFKQLAQATGTEPGWNFHKYLIAPGGTEVYSFATRTEPDAAAVMAKLRPMMK